MNNRELFLRHQAQTSHFPLALEIASAEGNWIIDVAGKRYLDLISGISVSHLGHGNTRVKQAIMDQLDRHQHLMVYGELVQDKPAQLAKALTDLLPASLNSVYLLNSGAEATDVAMKLSKRLSGRTNIVACKNAYHGSTHAALSLNSDAYFSRAYRPLLPGIRFIRFNNTESLEAITPQTAAVFTEVIQGEAGYLPAQKEFLEALRKRCDETGALLVFDEIQSGIGKTGRWFAFEHYGVQPDILLLGKALGAGMPIGAVVTSREHMLAFADQPVLGHITTFGGHPVIAAAALEGINVLKDSGLLNEVAQKEQLFRQLLVHPAIRSISGMGLMLGVELDDFDHTLRVIQEALREGVMSDWFLFASAKVRIAPPLTITREEIEFACHALIAALDKVYA